jgi:molybdopterin molybdotransferase
VSTFEALGRVLAAGRGPALDVPPADNTSMDGYALRAADVPAAGTVLPVSQRIPAGVVGQPLQPGTAARIFTGAQVPPGADAVVMQEQCEPLPPAMRRRGSVRVERRAQPGQWIRRRGEDVRQGADRAGRGTRLTPQALGWRPLGARADGAAPAARGVFSTGDELVMPGEPLQAPAPSTTPTASRCAACCRPPAARCRTWASCPTGWTPRARRCARRPQATT